MENNKTELKELRNPDPFRLVYDDFAAGVAYISVIDKNGDERIGSCFHVGDGVFVTARHVIEGCTIKEIGTTVHKNKYLEMESSHITGVIMVERTFSPTKTESFIKAYYHPNKDIDVAAIIIPDLKNAPVLELGGHLDEFMGDELILTDCLLMGYPLIPFSREPLLISSKCEVNAIVDKYTGGHPLFILSTMARGGFSGGPVITTDGIVLGLVTESLTSNYQPTELGYLSVLSVEGIFSCLFENKIEPEELEMCWGPFWNLKNVYYKFEPKQQIILGIHRGNKWFYFEIHSPRKDVFECAIDIINRESSYTICIEAINESFIRILFKRGTIDLENADKIFQLLKKMVEELGINFINEFDNHDLRF